MEKRTEIRKALAGVASLAVCLIATFGLWLVLRNGAAQAQPDGPQPTAEVNLLAVGDIMLGRGVAQASAASPEGLQYTFAAMAGLRRGADLVFGNLESPLVAPEHLAGVRSDGYLFPASPETAGALRSGGFDLLTLANNHSLDYGPAGLRDTINSLKNIRVRYVGAGETPAEAQQTVYIERNGLKLAFIAATAVTPTGLAGNEQASSPVALFDQARILTAIRQARPRADVVILALHWGVEYEAYPSTSQRDFARQASEAGADVILGAHPHVVGQFEMINRTFVAYSLGNFIFDSRFPPESRESVALYLKLDKKGVAAVQAIPLKIDGERPRSLNPEERESGLARLATLAGDDPALKAQAVFWNGTAWKTAPAMAYKRDTTTDNTINLPAERIIQVRDLNVDRGGYTTGKAVDDFANEPQTDQRIELKNGHLRVWRPEGTDGRWQLIWESKPSWQIEQFDFGDADEDGRPELVFTLWKSDGPDDARQVRSHPFVYGWRRDAFRPVWAGSALADPIREFALNDLMADGGNELVVLEGSYDEAHHAPAHHVLILRWVGWNYEVLYRGPVGNFSALSYVPGQPYAFYRGQ